MVLLLSTVWPLHLNMEWFLHNSLAWRHLLSEGHTCPVNSCRDPQWEEILLTTFFLFCFCPEVLAVVMVAS